MNLVVNHAGGIYLECAILYRGIPARYLLGKNRKINPGIYYISN